MWCRPGRVGRGGCDWAGVCEAQRMRGKGVPNPGGAVVIDGGEGKDIHAKNRGDVAKRLARWGLAETYKVRKVSYGVGVERTFPVHSPSVAKIEVLRRGDVRRAKLYYLRDRAGKAAKIREKRES